MCLLFAVSKKYLETERHYNRSYIIFDKLLRRLGFQPEIEKWPTRECPKLSKTGTKYINSVLIICVCPSLRIDKSF